MLRFFLFLAALTSTVTFAQDMTPPRVVPSEKLADFWLMANTSIDANVPNSGRNLNVPGCATVSFVVEKDGSTSQIKVQRVVPQGDLGRLAASVAAGLHFAPTAHNAGKRRVFSWLIFPFNLPPDPDARKQIMQACVMEHLGWKDR